VVADHGQVGLLCSDNGKEFCGEVLTVRRTETNALLWPV
jgi:hypothetical protein